MDTNYSIADLATITNGCNGNMGGSLWFIILFFLIFNNNGWGNRGYGNGDFGTLLQPQARMKYFLDSVSQVLIIRLTESVMVLQMLHSV